LHKPDNFKKQPEVKLTAEHYAIRNRILLSI